MQEVIYQIGNLHDLMAHYRPAAKYFQYLITKVPSDPGALARLGQICAKDDDETQAFHYHHEVSLGVDVSLMDEGPALGNEGYRCLRALTAAL